MARVGGTRPKWQLDKLELAYQEQIVERCIDAQVSGESKRRRIYFDERRCEYDDSAHQDLLKTRADIES